MRLTRFLLACCLTLLAVITHAQSTPTSERVPHPTIEPARGGSCVEDIPTIRRNHMFYLKHQRDETVHNGIRGAKYSLQTCISCHASQQTNSVNASPTNFCISCHNYAAVKIDCFECHATSPKP